MKELTETNTKLVILTLNPRHFGLPITLSANKRPNLNKLANLSSRLILFVVCTKNNIDGS